MTLHVDFLLICHEIAPYESTFTRISAHTRLLACAHQSSFAHESVFIDVLEHKKEYLALNV